MNPWIQHAFSARPLNLPQVSCLDEPVRADGIQLRLWASASPLPQHLSHYIGYPFCSGWISLLENLPEYTHYKCATMPVHGLEHGPIRPALSYSSLWIREEGGGHAGSPNSSYSGSLFTLIFKNRNIFVPRFTENERSWKLLLGQYAVKQLATFA